MKLMNVISKVIGNIVLITLFEAPDIEPKYTKSERRKWNRKLSERRKGRRPEKRIIRKERSGQTTQRENLSRPPYS